MKILFLANLALFSWLATAQTEEKYTDTVVCGKFVEVKNETDKIKVKLKKVHSGSYGKKLTTYSKKIEQEIIFTGDDQQDIYRQVMLMTAKLVGYQSQYSHLCLNQVITRRDDNNPGTFDFQIKSYVGGGQSVDEAYQHVKNNREGISQ